MYLLAGLPISTLKHAIGALEAAVPGALVKGVPASKAGDARLYPEGHVSQLVRTCSEFVIRRRTNGPGAPPTPATITLLFVPSPDEEDLLEAFDFAVMAVPLSPLVARDEKGRQLRHSCGATEQAIRAATEANSEGRRALHEVVRRLARQADNEGLLLPPRNFAVGEHDLVPTFRTFRQGSRPWTDRLAELGPAALTHEDIGRVPPQKTRHAFVDGRGVAFLIAHPSAYDGLPRSADNDDDIGELLSVLRTLYRFGGALAPGLHHDAQRRDGSSLGGAIFHCDRDGRVRVGDTYANIYPNDYVRAKNKISA